MQNTEITEFVTAGAPRQLADAIEQLARAQGHVAALVVPWESTATTLSMAVTSVKSDGWAIAHTNLGTISLTADGASTRVTIAAAGGGSVDEKLAAVFGRFARDVRQCLEPGTSTATEAR